VNRSPGVLFVMYLFFLLVSIHITYKRKYVKDTNKLTKLQNPIRLMIDFSRLLRCVVWRAETEQ